MNPIICPFKQDNSLQRHKIRKLNQAKKGSLLLSAKSKLLGKHKLQEIFDVQIEINQRLKQRIRNERIKSLNLAFYDLDPIIKIQAHVRGWLCRKAFEIISFKKAEESVQKSFQDMAIEIQHQLTIGDCTKTSAIFIQKNIKIFLWRQKIKRIKKTFENYYLKSTESFLRTFTVTLNHWSAKSQVSKLKFERFRSTRLQRIRENLAILRIKRAVKRKKFNIKTGRKMYRRLRRMRKRLSNATAESFPESINAAQSPQPSFFQMMQELQIEESTDSEQKELEKRLSLMKLSYNIRDSPDLPLYPLLGKKYYLKTIDMGNRQSLEPVQKFRNLSISTPPLATQKRLFFSSEMPGRLMAYPMEDKRWRRPQSSNSRKVSENMNFLKPTEIFIKKIAVEPEWEPKPVVKNPRQPSKKLTRSTISSLAKRKFNIRPKSIEIKTAKTPYIGLLDKESKLFRNTAEDWRDSEEKLVRKEFSLNLYNV